LRSRFRLTVALIATLVAVLLVAPGADARAKKPKVAKVGGISSIGQDWYNSKLKVRWKPVAGSTYQVRWGYKTAVLAKAKVLTSRSASMTSPTLSNRCIPWYVQVRAIKAGKVGPWSAAKKVAFKTARPNAPAYTTADATRTRTDQVRVEWAYTPYLAQTRLHWSRKPYGGLGDRDTAFLGQTARSAAVALKPVGPGDQFLNVAYGNPTFGRLEYTNGCKTYPHDTTPRTPYFAMLPKPVTPGPGTPLRFGSYNVERMWTGGNGLSGSVKMESLAFNIGDQNLDVLVLQEAGEPETLELIRRLAALAETDWAMVPATGSQQKILYRTSRYKVASSGAFGSKSPSSPSTPLLTPWARLEPTSGDPHEQSLFVVAVHLAAGPAGTSALQNKRYTHAAAGVLMREIAAENTSDLPVIAAGDFKGNFDDYCVESSSCVPEGQPTFIRGGFYDASAAVTRVGTKWGTVNKHEYPQKDFTPFPGARADFILLKGFTGSVRYVNVGNKAYAKKTPSDHNIIWADVRVPELP
jgi:hypothetical protein